MSEREVDLLLDDILESASRIQNYVEGLDYDSFLKNQMVIDAVVRNFEVIGEATNRIPSDIRDNYNSIEWNRIRGFRNRIIHAYFGIDTKIVWEIIQNYLDTLISNIEHMQDELK